MNVKRLTVRALQAALEAYSGPRPIDPTECCFKYTHANGFEELIPYDVAAVNALNRIFELENELLAIWSDPYIKEYRARVVKLVDTPDLKSDDPKDHTGSIPVSGTNNQQSYD